jgi:hypothetical protein
MNLPIVVRNFVLVALVSSLSFTTGFSVVSRISYVKCCDKVAASSVGSTCFFKKGLKQMPIPPVLKGRVQVADVRMGIDFESSDKYLIKQALGGQVIAQFLGGFIGVCLVFMPWTVSANPTTTETATRSDRGEVIFNSRSSQCHAGLIIIRFLRCDIAKTSNTPKLKFVELNPSRIEMDCLVP